MLSSRRIGGGSIAAILTAAVVAVFLTVFLAPTGISTTGTFVRAAAGYIVVRATGLVIGVGSWATVLLVHGGDVRVWSVIAHSSTLACPEYQT
ncbi:hypothetical protein ATK17_1297 [Branchiibius hedensis]|uniref:Uncharacterized protein n=1 Tax=Branchiibius hedensis TaxID=672460 RepID=A0A2Y8ZRP6_9MICO|nr:hypothetical protein ATK17_1297 [Branchiibius hedensis]SSA33998.1 hypothetical protein SAMN04489750_1297 [Branchiibius hedensis]